MNEPTHNAPAAAFFDLDGTLVVGQTPVLLVMFLRKARVVSLSFLIGTALWFLGYKMGLFRPTEAARERASRVFKGLTVDQVEALMDRFGDEVLMPRLHPAAAAALAEHAAEGDHVVIVSAALEPVVRSLAVRLGVTDYVGAGCEIQDGVYTGRLAGHIPMGEEKARVAAEFMSRWEIDPADCWAYADHGSDIALLQSVGHAVAVNPRRLLLQTARRAGWPILP